MRQAIHHLSVRARTRGLVEFTGEAHRFVSEQAISSRRRQPISAIVFAA
jgi:hypothetical protein